MEEPLISFSRVLINNSEKETPVILANGYSHLVNNTIQWNQIGDMVYVKRQKGIEIPVFAAFIRLDNLTMALCCSNCSYYHIKMLDCLSRSDMLLIQTLDKQRFLIPSRITQKAMQATKELKNYKTFTTEDFRYACHLIKEFYPTPSLLYNAIRKSKNLSL